MKTHYLLASAAMAGLLVVGCAPAGESGPLDTGADRAAVVASLGTPFDLEADDTAWLDEIDLSLHFVGVTGDSRCPHEVACIWAGNAAVLLEARREGATVRFELDTHPGMREEAEVLGVRVRLVGLVPHPVADQRPDPAAYVARITVEAQAP